LFDAMRFGIAFMFTVITIGVVQYFERRSWLWFMNCGCDVDNTVRRTRTDIDVATFTATRARSSYSADDDDAFLPTMSGHRGGRSICSAVVLWTPFTNHVNLPYTDIRLAVLDYDCNTILMFATGGWFMVPANSGFGRRCMPLTPATPPSGLPFHGLPCGALPGATLRYAARREPWTVSPFTVSSCTGVAVCPGVIYTWATCMHTISNVSKHRRGVTDLAVYDTVVSQT
jgi:hypothetical protein